MSERDPWSELDVVQDLVKGVADAELYIYPGSAHLFTDATLPEYDEAATRLVLQRSLEFLSRWP